MDEVKFSEFSDEFNIAKHLDLGNGTLLLLLRGERVVLFVIDLMQRHLNIRNLPKSIMPCNKTKQCMFVC